VKTKATVSIEEDVWNRSKIFFKENPEIGSISSFLENSLLSMLELMEPMMKDARAGRKKAALYSLQNSFADRLAETSQELKGLRTMIEQREVKKTPSKAKKKASR
jgi:hypothetical protein